MTEIADLLAQQDASQFRIKAYQRAAKEIAFQSVDLQDLARKGKLRELEALPTIGKRIANLIHEYALTGQSRYLNRLKGEFSTEKYLERIPGIGPTLAHRAVETLQINSLEDLEQAVHSGRLEQVSGFGKDRLRLTKVMLQDWLNRHRADSLNRKKTTPTEIDPSPELLLHVDQEYRRLVAEDQLKKIAPRRFNPQKEAWLPIFHIDLKGWHFTVLFSNTALAHQLKKQKEWVIIYYYNEKIEGQVTVVTETKGPSKGKRVIRGQSSKPDDLSVLQDW